MAPVQRALADENYKTPTPIQAQTIPAALEGRDVLGCAQTGTGKTAAFSLPMLQRVGERRRKSVPNRPFALVLAPTRELAIQIGASLATYGRHLKLRTALVYGGVNQGRQVRDLRRGAHIVVATPGRLLDLMNQGHIKLDALEMFVLDEADRMLDMGFLPDLKRIISQLPEERQSLFFSATLPPKIVELSGSLLRDPVSVNVTPETPSVERITQRVMLVDRMKKQSLLRHVLADADVDRAIVFTRTKRMANTLAEHLADNGVPAEAIHGNKSQNARQRALQAFRRKKVHVLVATDVAARGIDIDGITHVVNFDLPMEPENYVHRIGRTGRAGADGIAVSFCTPSERRDLRVIEQLIGQALTVESDHPHAPVRTGRPQGGARRRPSGDRGRKPSRPGRAPARHSGASSASSGPGNDSGGSRPKPKRRRRPRRGGTGSRIRNQE